MLDGSKGIFLLFLMENIKHGKMYLFYDFGVPSILVCFLIDFLDIALIDKFYLNESLCDRFRACYLSTLPPHSFKPPS